MTVEVISQPRLTMLGELFAVDAEWKKDSVHKRHLLVTQHVSYSWKL
jgi:hypothetical protein